MRFTSDSAIAYSGFALVAEVVDSSALARVTYSYAGGQSSSMVNVGEQITLPVFTDLFTPPDGTTFLGWQCGETLYGEGDPFTTSGNVTFAGLGAGTYTITDKYGNKSNFDAKGRLSSLVNNQETTSSINITYTDATKPLILEIKDGKVVKAEKK